LGFFLGKVFPKIEENVQSLLRNLLLWINNLH
jgi:hypothetical protein